MRRRPTYANVVATLALFVALGGTALATHPGGQNTISTADIINGQVRTDDLGNGEVRVADIGQGAVATDEIVNGQVKAADIGDGEVRSADIGAGQVAADELAANSVGAAKIPNGAVRTEELANGQVQAEDLAAGVAPGASGARAYARVAPDDCTPTTCIPRESKGISSVTVLQPGIYCITAPGINANVTPAAATVDWKTRSIPRETHRR